jgi:integrase
MAKPTKTPAGTYRVITDFGGRRRSATFPTLKAARAGQARMLVEMGSQPVAMTATIGDLLSDYIEGSKDRLSASFLYNARNIERRLPVAVLDLTAETVAALKIEAVYRSLLADGWGPHSVSRLHGILGSAFKRAARYGLITVNPMQTVEPPVAPRATVHPPTTEQVRALIASASSPLCALTYSLAASTGARRGELVGLRWGDIDFEAGRISIVRSLAKAPGRPIYETPTKTGTSGQRVISADAETMRMLAAHRPHASAAGWVLSPTDGIDPWRPGGVTRAFYRDMRRAGMEGAFRFHDLRHYHATQLLAGHVPPFVVAKRLGHRRIDTTIGTYAHWVPGTDREAADIIARVMRGD